MAEPPIIPSLRARGCKPRWAGNRWMCLCPAHDDSSPSLAVVRSSSGATLIHCFAGCEPEDIVESVGLTMADLGDGGGELPDAVRQLAGLRGWQPHAIEAIGGYSAGLEVWFPMRDAGGVITGHRRRRADGQAYDDGAKALAVKGSKNGLIYHHPLPDGPVLLVEGEADAVAALSAGHSAVVATPGATPGRQVWDYVRDLLKDRHVIMAPDPGDAGTEWSKKVVHVLRNVKTITPGEKDLDDRLRDGESLSDIITTVSGGQTRAQIHIAKAGLRENVRDAVKALQAAGAPIYQRGGQLVRPQVTPHRITVGGVTRNPGAVTIRAVDTDWLRLQAMQHMDFLKYDPRAKDDPWTPCAPTPEILSTIISVPDAYNWPELLRIARHPVLFPDGRRTALSGYDPESALLIDAPGKWGEIPATPSRDDAVSAVRRVLQVFRHYEFAEPVDRSVVLSLLLTAVMRPALDIAPGHAIDAPAAGSGKSLIVDAASILGSGAHASVVDYADSPEEFSKRIDTSVLAGDLFLNVDNVETPIHGSALCQTITQSSRKIRVLGKSEQVLAANNSIVTFTGNNITIKGDMTRRVLVSRIDPQCEDPSKRVFDQDLLADVYKLRGQLVRDLHTIVAAYLYAGKPDQHLSGFGSFAQYNALIRAAIVWADQPDPVEVMDRIKDADPAREDRRLVLDALRNQFVMAPFTAQDVIDRIEHDDALKEALKPIAWSQGDWSSRKLSYWLRSNKDTLTGGTCLKHAGRTSRNVTQWFVQTLSGGNGSYGHVAHYDETADLIPDSGR